MLTAVRLRELLRYEPDTGRFYWVDQDRSQFRSPQAYGLWLTHRQGKSVGIGRGYCRVWLDGRSYLAHRWRVNSTGEVIPYDDHRIKQSKDEFFHRCSIGGDFTRDRSLCLYVPDQGF